MARIGGFNLRTRMCNFLGEEIEVPEHVVPVILKKKNGEPGSAYWQVRISKPFRSFQVLNDAIDFLSKEILKNPPKREAKFDFNEQVNKLYKTGSVGIYVQSRSFKETGKVEIRLQLTFKKHVIKQYIGTTQTASKLRYKDAFVELYVTRKWLEKLSVERDFGWRNEKGQISSSLSGQIPSAFRDCMAKRADSDIVYEGFEAFLEHIKAKQ